jgi:hypothetical protein
LIDIGFQPEDYQLASYIQNKLGHSSEHALSNINLEEARLTYQKKEEKIRELTKKKVSKEIKGIEKISMAPAWFNNDCVIIINKEENFLGQSYSL